MFMCSIRNVTNVSSKTTSSYIVGSRLYLYCYAVCALRQYIRSCTCPYQREYATHTHHPNDNVLAAAHESRRAGRTLPCKAALVTHTNTSSSVPCCFHAHDSLALMQRLITLFLLSVDCKDNGKCPPASFTEKFVLTLCLPSP